MGEFVIIARRKGNDWYLGALNNSKQREVKIPLTFLPRVQFTAEIIHDGRDVNSPNTIVQEQQQVTSSDTLSATLAAKGGCVIHFRKY